MCRLIDAHDKHIMEFRFQSIPYLNGDVLGGRIVETFDLVQKLVIEDIKHAGETFLQIEEVDHEARTQFGGPSNWTSTR
jgi:hypothetical protein